MQWAGLGMWVALTLSACTPTKREVGNLNRSKFSGKSFCYSFGHKNCLSGR